MTKFAIIAVLAAGLALAGCNSPEAEAPEPTPLPPAEPAQAIGNTLNAPAGAVGNIASVSVPVNEPALRATTLGTLNGCRIDRVIVDGKAFVLASAVKWDYSSYSTSYGFASCNLVPVG